MEDRLIVNHSLHLAMRIAALVPAIQALFHSRASPSRQTLERHILALLHDAICSSAGAVLVDDYVPEPCGVPESWMQQIREERRPLQGPVSSGFGMAAPISVHDESAGLIYLERTSAPFEEDEVLLLSAMASICAAALAGAYRQEWLETEVSRLEDALPAVHSLAGESRKVRELRERIERIAPTASTVLITGESGTGKELVARALHKGSLRALKPFVAINCAALTETLLESELFGHEKGAFTGAVVQKRGRLESAEGGTVFLDEIGEMPASLQAKLLRVLQAREFERVGGTRTIALNIRLVAATNRDLESAARNGGFRQDLFYRLNVISIKTPSLRERPEDIVTLALVFATRFAAACGRQVQGISPEARSLLRAYCWPGNVRELENAMEHAVVLGATETVRAEDLPEAVREVKGPDAATGNLQDAINQAKRGAVSTAFEQCQNDHLEAARLLGVHPNYLYRLIRNLGMHELLKGMARD